MLNRERLAAPKFEVFDKDVGGPWVGFLEYKQQLALLVTK